MFERIGYHVTLEEVPDWDVLWMHDYPFTVFKNKMLNLKPHQRVCIPSLSSVMMISFVDCLEIKQVMF